jgi:hypothetical protein
MSSSGACTPLSLLHPTHLQVAARQNANTQLQQEGHSLHGKFHHGHLAARGIQAARHRSQQLSKASRVATKDMGSSVCSVHNATARRRNDVIHLRFGRDNVRWVRGNQIKKRAKSLPAQES